MRFTQLDAVRGIAAAIVVANHFIQIVPEPIRQAADWSTVWPWFRFTPLRLLTQGQAAVDLFFILSGFVLTLPLVKDKEIEILPFLVKRFFRIYVPFAIAILAVAAIFRITPFHAMPNYSAWFNHRLVHSFSLGDHLLMTGKDISLDPPIWTLIHEMRMAILMPFIWWGFTKFRSLPTLTITLAVSAAASLGLRDSISGSWTATFHFVWMFAAGGVLAVHQDRVRQAFAKLPMAWSLCLLGAGLLLMMAPFDRVWCDFVIGVGGVLVIALALSRQRLIDLLASPVPQWLGRISYSLYLTHLPVLVWLVGGLGLSPAIALLAIVPLAEIFYRLVEAPSARLGRRLSKWQPALAAAIPAPVIRA